MLAGITKMSKKKKDETPEESGVSEYIVRQRLREVAPDAWPADKCPKCKRNWNTKLDTCKKCKISADEARIEYANLLAEKVPTALKVMGKKKSADIRTLAKKTKSTDYNAGVIAAAMVDTGVTEIVKVGTPFRSFIMNIAGLAFLVVTWQQLLGDSASTFQTTITIVGAAMSLAVIIALFVSRKTQVEKFQSDMDEGKKWMPTEEEAAAEADEDAAKEMDEETEIVEEESETDDSDVTPETEEDEYQSPDLDESKDAEDVPESEEYETDESEDSEEDSFNESSND
jgi:hypothetical protein